MPELAGERRIRTMATRRGGRHTNGRESSKRGVESSRVCFWRLMVMRWVRCSAVVMDGAGVTARPGAGETRQV